MGLNVCKRIVNFFGGDMTVSSEYGMGTKFTFTFSVTEVITDKNNSFIARQEELTNTDDAHAV